MTNIIEVSFGGGSIAYVKVDTAYFYNNGILFKPTDIDLPASYQVHWADSPQASSTLETIGTAEGAPIPDDLWNRSRVIYGWIYLHPTEDSAVTYKEVRIYKNARAGMPDGTEPTPAEQSTIDQLISALNSAVEQTGEDVESAEQARDDAESARDTAQGYATQAQTSANSAQTSASQASASASASAQSASASAQIKSDIEGMVDDAQGYAQASAQSATASANSATTAQGYAQSASASAQSASTSASAAQTSANTASTKASEASTSAQTASQKATEASQSASQALSYKTDAESAKTASQTAQGLAEQARNEAGQIKTDVQNIADGIDTRLVDVEDALSEKAPVITDTASGSIASFSDGADNLPLKSLIVDINPIQDLSHGDPSPENLCPISGWTEVGVEQRGKNLFNVHSCVPFNQNVILTFESDGSMICENRNAYALIPTTAAIMKVPHGTYTISTNGQLSAAIAVYASDDGQNFTWISNGLNPQVKSKTFTFDKKYMQLRWQISANTTDTLPPIMVEVGSTATPYEPYTGRSITINLGQTVYGGKLDVISGELTVYPYYASYNGETLTGVWISDRDKYVSGATPTIGAQVVDMSGTGTTYTLDPQTVRSLYGQNNIFADSGDTEVEYRADTKLFIKRLTAPDSADMVADANITSGQYFMVGDSLYKATANIANGSTIIVGTNCIRKSLSEALNEINA